jgi:hypothetical protein
MTLATEAGAILIPLQVVPVFALSHGPGLDAEFRAFRDALDLAIRDPDYPVREGERGTSATFLHGLRSTGLSVTVALISGKEGGKYQITRDHVAALTASCYAVMMHQYENNGNARP